MVVSIPADTILYANKAIRTLAEIDTETSIFGLSIDVVFCHADAELLRAQAESVVLGQQEDIVLITSCGKHLLIRRQQADWNGVPAYLFELSDQSALQKQNEKLVGTLNHIPSGIGIYQAVNQIREGADTVDFTCRMLNGR